MVITWNEIEGAAKALKDGELVTFPTETVYGIGCIFDNEEAFKKLVAFKKRPPNKPFAMMADSLERALPYLEPTPKVRKLMEHFLPGELTVLLKAKDDLPWHVTLGTGVIGLRVPDSKDVQALLREAGKPCLVTSANISGEPTARNFEELTSCFKEETLCVKGECVSEKPSTIVLATGEELKLIREGALPFERLLRFWEEN